MVAACGASGERSGFGQTADAGGLAQNDGPHTRPNNSRDDGGPPAAPPFSTFDGGLPDGSSASCSKTAADGICPCVRIGILGKPGFTTSSDLQKWLQDRGTSVNRIQTDGNSTLTAADLAGFDMVILDWLQKSYSPDEVKTFNTWLNAGHGVLGLSGFSDDYDVTRPNGLLAGAGFGYSAPNSITGRQEVTNFTAHPVTTAIHSVTFFGGSEVLAVGQVAPPNTRTAFASLNSQIVGGVFEGPNARAVVWGDEWIEFDSEWRALPDVNRFWVNIVDFLSGRCPVPPAPR